MTNQCQSHIPQQYGNARGLSPVRVWGVSLTLLLWQLTHMLTLHCPNFKMTLEVLSVDNPVPKFIWPTKPLSVTRSRKEAVWRDKVRIIYIITLYTTLPEWRIMHSLKHSCKYHRLGKTKDISAGADGGLAAQETTVLKPGRLCAVFGEREGKGRCICGALAAELPITSTSCWGMWLGACVSNVQTVQLEERFLLCCYYIARKIYLFVPLPFLLEFNFIPDFR